MFRNYLKEPKNAAEYPFGAKNMDVTLGQIV